MTVVFCAERWAEAFIASCSGDEADNVFEILKVMARGIERIKGHIAGTADAYRVEKMMRTAMKKACGGIGDFAKAEIACRTLLLLVQRGLFGYRQALIEEIGKALDRKHKVLSVTLETVAPLPAAFRNRLEQSIREKIHAGEIRLTEKIVPEILGGYKLRIGTRVIDASVGSLLQNMAKEIMR